jgi:hypothetical protein
MQPSLALLHQVARHDDYSRTEMYHGQFVSVNSMAHEPADGFDLENFRHMLAPVREMPVPTGAKGQATTT